MTAAILFGIATGPAFAAPITIQAYITVPTTAANVQPGGAFSSFDIGYVDPVTGNYFIADRSNASVDIISGSSLVVLGQATGFTGQQATTSVSGADGVVTVTSGGVSTLYAGDGNSTLKVFNVTNPAAPSLLQSLSTGGSFRVDEMAYSPLTHQILAANNADSPAYGNLFSTTGPAASPAALLNPPGHITIPAAQGGIADGGLEQPVWVPNAAMPGGGSFYISVPALAGSNNPGGVAEISTTGVVLRTIDFATLGVTSCSPTGLALGGSGNLLVGCGNVGASAILLNPAGTGSIVKQFTGLGGTDEIWYDPTTKMFYVTGNNGTNTSRFFDVVTDADFGGVIAQTIALPATTSAHSIAVDPFNGNFSCRSLAPPR